MSFEKFLITGGAGFIGSHLADSLLKSGCKVTIIDDLSTGRWGNIAHLSENPLLRVIIASASDHNLLEKEIQEHEFVYHLASAVGVKLIIDQPVYVVENIVETSSF